MCLLQNRNWFLVTSKKVKNDVAIRLPLSRWLDVLYRIYVLKNRYYRFISYFRLVNSRWLLKWIINVNAEVTSRGHFDFNVFHTKFGTLWRPSLKYIRLNKSSFWPPPLHLVRILTKEWRHQKNGCTLLLRPCLSSFPVYLLYGWPHVEIIQTCDVLMWKRVSPSLKTGILKGTVMQII